MIKAIAIIEIMGKPADYIKEMMNELLDNLAKEKGVKISNKKTHEPKPLKDNNEIFTSFAELELDLDDMIALMNVIFNYTPSHIEIIEPENLKVDNTDLNAFFNELIMRLHRYDEIAKSLVMSMRILENQLIEAGIKPGLPPLPNNQQNNQKVRVQEIGEEKETKKKKKN